MPDTVSPVLGDRHRLQAVEERVVVEIVKVLAQRVLDNQQRGLTVCLVTSAL